jgi:hypothetical protein
MGLNGVGRSINGITTVSRSRARQTPRPAVSFKKVMLGGAQVLLSGAKVASRIVGGPLLSAAVSADGGKGTGASLGEGPSSSGGEMDSIKAYQDQRFGEDLKLLELQQKIQSNNRQITMLSNVMKARHDTEKSAISNIRS